jgi:hypothetical protein
MHNHIQGIDHAIIGVRDLEAARAGFARLGFTPTPLGRHQGWGTANHCLMLERDYVELLGIVDPAAFTNDLDRLLEAREGLLGLALASDDPAATHAAWRAAGLASADLADLARSLETEPPATLRFRNVMLARDELQGLGLFACHHLTPEPMRRPGWLRHENGARAIASVTVMTPEPESLAPVLARVFGHVRLTVTDRIYAAHTGHGVILVATPDDVDMLHPELEALPPADGPVLAALSLLVDDPDRTAAFLTLQGIPHARDRSGAVGVSPAHAHGVMLEFLPPSAAPEAQAALG